MIVTPASIPNGTVRDADDEAVLSCAIGGKADYIVSGDDDLLTLKVYQNIPIITVAHCLAILGN
jgi:predicted nucleic acid-binding protein